MSNSKSLLFAGFWMALTLTACGPDYIYQSEKKITAGQWMYRDSLVFDFEVQDTTALYNLFLNIDAQNAFSTENIYVQLHTAFPDGKRLSKVMSFNIFDSKGQILGKTSGEKAHQHIMLQENTFFNQAGKYKIVVEQYMRQDSLPGINAIGLDIEKTAQKK